MYTILKKYYDVGWKYIYWSRSSEDDERAGLTCIMFSTTPIENEIYTVIGGIDTINIMPKIRVVKGVRRGLAKTLTIDDSKAIANESPFIIL